MHLLEDHVDKSLLDFSNHFLLMSLLIVSSQLQEQHKHGLMVAFEATDTNVSKRKSYGMKNIPEQEMTQVCVGSSNALAYDVI